MSFDQANLDAQLKASKIIAHVIINDLATERGAHAETCVTAGTSFSKRSHNGPQARLLCKLSDKPCYEPLITLRARQCNQRLSDVSALP